MVPKLTEVVVPVFERQSNTPRTTPDRLEGEDTNRTNRRRPKCASRRARRYYSERLLLLRLLLLLSGSQHLDYLAHVECLQDTGIEPHDQAAGLIEIGGRALDAPLAALEMNRVAEEGHA